MNPVELMMRRRNVDAFEKADPIELRILRAPEPTKTDAGGWVQGDSEPLPAPFDVQSARIVHNTRRYKAGLVNTEAGDIPDTDYLLIGSHTLNVEADDVFIWDGDYYKIIGVHPWRFESKLCALQFSGPPNRS